VFISANEILLCRDCDTAHRRITLGRNEFARCIACGAVLAKHHRWSTDQLLAVTLAAAVLCLIANTTPVLGIELGDARTEANIWLAAASLQHGWAECAALVLGITMFLIPVTQIALLLWVLSFARMARRAPGLRNILVALHLLRPWSMTEVFLLGALVAIVKLSSWVHVVAGVGIWALAGLTILLTILSLVEPQFWWDLLDEAEI
jgi:paraquat-inducible protein A